MTKATIELIDQLCDIIDKSKYLILSGTMAVGKTYLANLIAERCREAKYNAQGIYNKSGEYEIETELISIHPSFYYEDFVNGITIDTESGNINFHYADKVFLTMLKKANKSWEKKEDKKYFLILDDISRGAISGILGDMLPLIEPHGLNVYRTVLSSGETISVSPNVYIIATRSTIIDSVEQMNYGFLRHFYEFQLRNDYLYMCDTATDVYSDYDMSANALFYRTKRIVTDHLRHRYQMSLVEKERYIIGHGVYKESGTALIARNQIIPLLRQYVKDNVLAKTANVSIAALQKLVDGQYSKDRTLADVNRIVLQKTGITADSFRAEGLTHQPLVNLVSRIKEQGLVDDSDIANDIMFNPQVVVRKKAKLDKVERDFPTPGYLYIEKTNRDIYTYGTTKNKAGAAKRPRFFYSGNANDAIAVDGVDYAIASEMQPGEYSRWYEELDSGNEENERYSSSPNSIMFRILRSYYRALSKHYGGYLSEYPGDENIARLKAYAEQEYKHLVSESRKLHPEVSDEKDVNAKANDDFRDVIHDLVLLWKDRGETISVGGQTILVEGVYNVDSSKRYEEYARAMETLGIHQMIMQGPPGTSKTYSAREYLKYEACKKTGTEIADTDLDALQITDYKEGATISKWSKDNGGKAPDIAWDIVQFHPSYGYEDFVRGIEVGTIKTEHGSNVSYETVNKILGKIAEVASRKEYENTKFFLVIDEINRANLATVFGELIYGLEYRGRSVATPYTVKDSNKVELPNNLYIIGTMNTADKSIGGIDYKKISRLDLNNIKTTGIYVYYKPVINAAKMVLSEITLEATGNSAITSYVVPYAISMDKLFEMYVRAYLKKAGIGSYDSKEPGIKLSQYDDKTAVLRERTKAYSKYIAGNIKPDIIIYNDENDNYLVFDVKYKNPLNSRSSRPDRLQILAYALMLNCKNVGNIFPTQDGTSNTYFKRNEINSREEKTRYYNQINVAIDTEWEFTIQEEGGTSMTTILEYCKRLLV